MQLTFEMILGEKKIIKVMEIGRTFKIALKEWID